MLKASIRELRCYYLQGFQGSSRSSVYEISLRNQALAQARAFYSLFCVSMSEMAIFHQLTSVIRVTQSELESWPVRWESRLHDSRLGKPFVTRLADQDH